MGIDIIIALIGLAAAGTTAYVQSESANKQAGIAEKAGKESRAIADLNFAEAEEAEGYQKVLNKKQLARQARQDRLAERQTAIANARWREQYNDTRNDSREQREMLRVELKRQKIKESVLAFANAGKENMLYRNWVNQQYGG